jgi:hypothetical protein
MKFTTATTLLLATLTFTLATPIAEPTNTVAVAVAAAAPLHARAANFRLEERKKKKPKAPKNGNNTNDTSIAAGTIAPSRVLELGALGLGVMEIVRLWG